MAKRLDDNATLTERIDLEPSLAIFRVRPDQLPAKDAGPWFVPGQYVTIGMNRDALGSSDAASDAAEASDDRPASVRRPMSIASAPEQTGEIEFYIRKVGAPESELPLTHLMWPIAVGDRLYVRTNPTGKFTVADTIGDDDPRLKVCVAAGTGLAPFVSMARSRVLRDPKGARLDDFAIIHGASYPTGLGYREELEAWSREYGLRYLPTVSRAAEVPAWKGASGRAEACFAPDRLAATEAALGLREGELVPGRAAVLICGLQGTIANTVTSLMYRGYVPDNRRLRRSLGVPADEAASVFWEQYDNTPIVDVNDEALMADLRGRLGL